MRRLLIALLGLAAAASAGCGNTCADACDKLKECFKDDAVTDTCVESCDAELADGDTEAQQRCIDCIVDVDCAAYEAGEACVEECQTSGG